MPQSESYQHHILGHLARISGDLKNLRIDLEKGLRGMDSESEKDEVIQELSEVMSQLATLSDKVEQMQKKLKGRVGKK